MKLCKAVDLLKLFNRVKGDNVSCPECHLAIADGEIKVVASGFVRHQNCHQKWRCRQGYQEPVAAD